ncbi:hypothetical protein HJC23_000075 [Cyclotella cryptica]|uniref:PH domain-containing protein n=1 Tax=Cyclotella cryptica TaxID=29204 RepID=A0ABD3PI59_9STRA
MPALTDRERAKRAKMVARFNAIKHQTSMTSDSSAISGLPSVASSLPAEEREGNDSSRLDDYLSSKNESNQQANASDMQEDEPAAKHGESTPKNSPESAPYVSEPTNSAPQPKPAPFHDLSVKVSSTTTPATPSKDPSAPTPTTPRSSRSTKSRSTSIADAKKKLAAARMVSSSPSRPNRDKAVIGEIATKMSEEERTERRQDAGRKSEVESTPCVAFDNEHDRKGRGEHIAVNRQMGSESKRPSLSVNTSAIAMTRSEKIAKIRAKSPRFADRYIGRQSYAIEDGIEDTKSDGFDKRLSTASTERWSEEFTKPVRPEHTDDCSQRLNDGFDAPSMSDEFNSQRLSHGSVKSEASSKCCSIENMKRIENLQTGGKKTWHEQAKIAEKARKYRQWQQNSMPSSKVAVQNKTTEAIAKLSTDECHGKTKSMQEGKEKVNAHASMNQEMKGKDSQVSDHYPFDSATSEEAERVPPVTREAFPHYETIRTSNSQSTDTSHQTEEPICPLTPSRMASLQGKQEYHMKMMAAASAAKKGTAVLTSPPASNLTSPLKEHFEKENAVNTNPSSSMPPSLLHSVSESSSAKPKIGKSANTASLNSDASEYKVLVPSRSDAQDSQSKSIVSKFSEPLLNQLTVSTSDVQSFIPIEEGSGEGFSPKLAGEEFLTNSKDTDVYRHSDEFDKPHFQNNAEWPMDAFSASSWGGEQPSTSEDSKWDNTVPDTPNSLTKPATFEEKNGWNLHTNALTVVEWEGKNEEQVKSTNDVFSEWEAWGHAEWNYQQTNEEGRDNQVNVEARAEAEARINELEEQDYGFQLDEASCSVQYEGFGAVEHADCPSRRDSRDASPRPVSSPDVQSKCSEGTMGTATEFDPMSMFEASDSLSDGIIKNDSFPACDMEENDVSAISWASVKVLKPNDDSSNSAFASLRSGAPMDASTLFDQEKQSVDTPSGKESLGSWWQSRYASTQNKDINAAVQEALMKGPPSTEEQRSDHPTERCPSSQRCTPDFVSPPEQSELQRDAVQKDPLSARSKRYPNTTPSSPDDDDSIFGDLDDDSFGFNKRHTSSTSKNNSRRKSSLSKFGTIISNAETEDDIFAGVSVSSRQVIRPKEKTANPMKSLLDGSTTTESHSLFQKTKTSSKEPECPLPKAEEQKFKPLGLFMMDGTYGVINLKNSDDKSPTASVTSDITTSVIFGVDFGKKRSLTRRGVGHSMEKDIPEAIVEVHDMLSGETTAPLRSPTKNSADVHGEVFDNDDVENVDPHSGQGRGNSEEANDFSKDPTRIRSLMSQSTTDEATQQNNSSLLKKALLMAKNGSNLVEETASASKAKCAFNHAFSESGGMKRPAFLSNFACGLLGASSFAFCATKDTTTMTNGTNDDDIAVAVDDYPEDGSGENKGDDTVQGIATKENYTKSMKLERTESTQETRSRFDIIDAVSRSDNESHTDEGMPVATNAKSMSRFNLEVVSNSDDESHTDDGGESDDCNSEDIIEVKSTSSEEDSTTLADEQTLNTNGQTVSTYDRTISTYDKDDSLDEGETDEDERSEFTDPQDEGTEIAELVPLSDHEQSKWKDWASKDSAENCILSPRSKKTLQEEQSRAYEKLLFYAYTALTVPPPSDFGEKGDEPDPKSACIVYPPVLSPRGAELRCEAMKQLLTRLGEEGMEVLKLNRERKWQPRFLTITKEVVWFKKSDDIRYSKIDCCPQGLLWVKKFNGHSKEHSVTSVGKNGKGGIMFSGIKSVSVTTDNFTLSKKQKKGKFNDSFTFVLHSDFGGTKRDILFRCCSKEDICTLSAGFQAIIDRIKNETVVVPRKLKSQQDKLPMPMEQVISPRAVAKPFSPKTSESDDRWEV